MDYEGQIGLKEKLTPTYISAASDGIRLSTITVCWWQNGSTLLPDLLDPNVQFGAVGLEGGMLISAIYHHPNPFQKSLTGMPALDQDLWF